MERKVKESPIEPKFLDMICQECHVALKYPHGELNQWCKCCFCGYTEINPTQEKAEIINLQELEITNVLVRGDA